VLDTAKGSRLIAVSTRMLPRLVKRVQGGLDLTHQHIGAVRERVAPLDQSLCDLAGLLYSPPQFLRKHRAGREMRTNARREIRTTMAAPVCSAVEGVRAKFLLPKAPAAPGAFCDCMVPTINIEKDMLFGAQTARSLAVNMGHAVADGPNGIVGRYHLVA